MSIVFKELGFSYGEEGPVLLQDVSVEFIRKDITVLSGLSGCGKSTLLYLASGLYPSGAGNVFSGNVMVEDIIPDQLKAAKRCQLIAMMFQNPELQFCMDTVKNELIFCLENIQTQEDEIIEKVEEALEFCGILHLEERTLHSLSGGEKQKVMLACLVVLNPKWLLLDEPFANIDDASAKDIAAKLKRLHQERGTGILAVDHHLDHWMDVADQLCIFKSDQTFEFIPFETMNPSYVSSFGVAIPGQPYNIHKSEMDFSDVEIGEPILKIENLSVAFGNKQILHDISVSFSRGRIYAIVGECGCGKSTFFSALLGMQRYRGNVIFDGCDQRKRKRKDIGKIGFVTQNPQDQFIGDTVLDEVMISLAGDSEKETLSKKILQDIHLWRYREVSPYMLSQGQQRKLGVAALMAYPCRVLVCDEPTYAQDRLNTEAIMEGLIMQAKKAQTTFIFSTHDRQLAYDVADEIWEIKEGTVHAIFKSVL